MRFCDTSLGIENCKMWSSDATLYGRTDIKSEIVILMNQIHTFDFFSNQKLHPCYQITPTIKGVVWVHAKSILI